MYAEVVGGPGRGAAEGGFTLIELVFVLVIAGVLLGMMFGNFKQAAAQRSATSARDTYIWMTRRARATAIQRGTNVQVRLAPDLARAVVAAGTGTDSIMDVRYFQADFGSATTAPSGDSIMICYNPRGFATPCGPTTLPTTVTFTVQGKSAIATVQALGQVEATQ